MRIPGPCRFAAARLFVVFLALNCCYAETSTASSSKAAIEVQFPTNEVCPFPLDLVQPHVLPPAHKKIDPKHDVSLIGKRGTGGGLDFYSPAREAAMGKELAREVESSVRLVRDPVVTEYINRLGQRIVANSDAQIPFTIKVIDDDEVNAFALPGGYFYVNTGLILAAENEAGLAGVMAHEIAHVAARHATKNQTKNDIFNMASIPLMFFGGPAAIAARQALGLAVPMSMLKFSRNAEREADMLALQYGYAAGYDPQEYVKLFERLRDGEKKKSFLAKMFSTHPMNEDRIKRAQKEIDHYLPDRDQYIVDTSEFEQVRARVSDLSDRNKIDQGKFVPVLHRRGAAEPPPAQTKSSDSTQDTTKQQDSDRPTLRRHPQP
jgi:beta-barrel assembly-enhancing protease